MARPYRTWSSRTYAVSPRAGGCLLVCIGILILAVGAVLEWNAVQFLPGTVSATGTIIACDTAPPNAPVTQQGGGCAPTVSFQTQTGQQLTFKGSDRSTSYSVGETVAVVYHPNDPQDARLAPGGAWLFFVVFGSLFLLLGLFIYVRQLLSKARE